MFINNWYVACAADALKPGEPFHVRMLGADFVLFHDEDGEIVCMSDVCIHRGAALSHGKVHDNGRIACPYHGWEFGKTGQCLKIPALGADVTPPARARVDVYPVAERFGLIWVFLGDAPEEERPPLPGDDWLPEYYDTDNWRGVAVEKVAPINWIRAEENSIDGAHPSFVHKAFGSKRNPKVQIVPLDRPDDWTVGTTRERTASVRAQKSGRMAELETEGRGKNIATTIFNWCGITHRIDIRRADGLRIVTLAHRTPVDANSTRTFLRQMRNYLLDEEMDNERRRGIEQAIGEDVGVVQTVRPPRHSQSNSSELLTRADQLERAFREMIAGHMEKGWRIDVDMVERESKRQVFVIPSPGRRANPKNWVHKPVPLIAGSGGMVDEAGTHLD